MSYLSVEKQSVYSTVPAEQVTNAQVSHWNQKFRIAYPENNASYLCSQKLLQKEHQHHYTEKSFNYKTRYSLAQSAGDVDSPKECPVYDTKQSDGEDAEMLELWEMQSIPSLPLLLGPLRPGMVAPDTIYQPLRLGRIWHKVNFLSGV